MGYAVNVRSDKVVLSSGWESRTGRQTSHRIASPWSTDGFAKVFRKSCTGTERVIRYADDCVHEGGRNGFLTFAILHRR